MFEIVVHPQTLSGQAKSTVDGRDIHAGLESKREYGTWLKEQLEFHQFIENIDFVYLTELSNNTRGRPRINCFFTFDAAKHICLTSRSEQGRAYRQALIDLETEVTTQQHQIIQTPMQRALELIEGWKRLAELFRAPEHIGLIEASKALCNLGLHTALGGDVTLLLKSSAAMDNIRAEEVYLEPTELARLFDVKSAIEMNKILDNMGLQAKIQGEWTATDQGAPLCQKHAWSVGSKSGYNLKWNVEEIRKLMEQYLEA